MFANIPLGNFLINAQLQARGNPYVLSTILTHTGWPGEVNLRIERSSECLSCLSVLEWDTSPVNAPVVQ